MATITLTGKKAAEVMQLGNTIARAAASYAENKAVGTMTVTDASPMAISIVDAKGDTYTYSVG